MPWWILPSPLSTLSPSNLQPKMSFFGFDTTLPRDRPPAGEKRGFFEAPDPFAEVARAGAGRLDDDDDA